VAAQTLPSCMRPAPELENKDAAVFTTNHDAASSF
jgi:hypothetical protein